MFNCTFKWNPSEIEINTRTMDSPYGRSLRGRGGGSRVSPSIPLKPYCDTKIYMYWEKSSVYLDKDCVLVISVHSISSFMIVRHHVSLKFALKSRDLSRDV